MIAVLDVEEAVATEACEFWFTMSQNVASELAPAAAVANHFDK